MNLYSAIGAGVAYIIASLIAGRLLPIFHLATIIAVVVEGFIGSIVGGAINNDEKKDNNQN